MPGRRVEPLQVVDADDHRSRAGEQAKDGEKGSRDDPLLRRCSFRIGTKECDVERAQLRGRELLQDIVADRSEEVSESDERQPRLRRAGTTRENSHPVLLGLPHRVQPERRLADAGLTLDDEGRRHSARLRQELFDDGELRVPADDRSSGHA